MAGSVRQIRLTVLCSGNGSNLQAIIDACENGQINNAAVTKVIVNRKNAYAQERAKSHSIPCDYINLVSHGYHAKGETDSNKLQSARAKYDADLAQQILADHPDVIVLAGWMHIVGAAFIEPIEDARVPIINLHPALPGKYDGANAIGRAFADFKAGVLENDKTGVMVHRVIQEVDRGEPILIREVDCSGCETEEQLQERIHGVEHKLLVEATNVVIAEVRKNI